MPDRRALLLVAHGSRDPRWRAPFERLRDDLGRDPELIVELGYMEFASPTLPEAAASAARRGARHVRVLPLFMSGGGHVVHDIPALVDEARRALPHVTFESLGAVGEHPRFAALLRELAREEA